MIQLFRPFITEEAIDEVCKVLRSGWIGLGPKTEEFEKAFAKYVGSKYAVAVNSCTSALHLAMIINEIGVGDEVITTPLTFVSTNHAILYRKATPVFADIDEKYCIDPNSIKKLITKKTKAIVCVHYGGVPCDLEEIYNIANEYNLSVIEDAAHACGSVYKGKKIGSYGTTCFSFHAVKNLPTGDGGMITTNDEEQYNRLKKLVWMGIDKNTHIRTVEEKDVEKYLWDYNVEEVGMKYHMNDINAVIGLAQLKVLEEHNERRRLIANKYREFINNPNVIALPVKSITEQYISSQHSCAIRVKRRKDFINLLRDNNIATGVHYRLNTDYSMYKNCKCDIEFAKKAFDEIVMLPVHLLLTDEDVYKIINIINSGW